MIRILIVLLFLAPGGSAQGGQLPGLVAPANRWYCAGGSASRSMLSDTAVSERDLVADWHYDLEGQLCAPSLSWDQYVVLLEQRSRERAQIVILDADTGVVLQKGPIFPCPKKTVMAMWGRTIAIKSAKEELIFFRIGQAKVERSRRIKDKGLIQDFLLYRDILYLTAGTDLYAIQPSSLRVLWQRKGNYRGGPSILGDRLYCLSYEKMQVSIAVHDLSNGEVSSTISVEGENESAYPSDPFTGRIQVGRKLLVATFANPLRTEVRMTMNDRPIYYKDKHTFNSAIFTRLGEGEDVDLLRLAHRNIIGWAFLLGPRLTYCHLPGQSKGGAMTFDTLQQAEATLLSVRDRPGLLTHEDVTCLLTKGVAWVGDCAFRLKSGDLIRQGGVKESLTSPIPVKNGVMLTGPKGLRLTVFRDSVFANRSQGTPIGKNKGSSSGRLLLRNGSTIKGNFEYSHAAKNVVMVRKSGKKKFYPKEQCLMILDDNQHVVMAPSEDALLLGLERTYQGDQSNLYLSLAKKALRSNDPSTIKKYIDRASGLGATYEDTGRIQKRLQLLLKKKSLKPKVALTKKLTEMENAGNALLIDHLWQAIQFMPVGTKKELKVAMLRLLFSKAPMHPEAAKLINSWLPKILQKTRLENPADWLDFVVAAHQTKIQIIRPPSVNAKTPPADEKIVGASQHTWRKDIMGVRSERILVLTPLENPSQVARCLSMGETVCDALEEIFVGEAREISGSRPMVIHLFSTRDEYVAFGVKRGMSMSAAQGTLGYYSPGENITRLYLPDSPEDLVQMYETFVHELTHHWTFALCPLFKASEIRHNNNTTAGAWVVEGCADMMADFIYSPGSRTFSMNNSKARTLDIVAGAFSDQLIPWKPFFKFSYLHFLKLPNTPESRLAVGLHWHVGRSAIQSQTNVFYSQAAAVCHYLLRAEGGRYRKVLMEAISRHYRGDGSPWFPDVALGITSDELGERVVSFAKSLSRQGPTKSK